MIEIVDYSSWTLYEGLPEGSGRSEKQWLISQDGQVGLFKYPKVDPVSLHSTHEHVSEHLAYRLGDLLGVETARVDIGEYAGRIGSLSHLIVGEGEALLRACSSYLGDTPIMTLIRYAIRLRVSSIQSSIYLRLLTTSLLRSIGFACCFLTS